MNSSYPSRALGGFCVLKRRNFEFAKGLFRGEKREKKQTSSGGSNERTAVEKRGEKRDLRCAFSVFAHQNTLTLRASGILCASSSFFSQHRATLCAHHTKDHTHTHRERIEKRTNFSRRARNNTTIIRSRERLVSSFDFREIYI